MKPATRYTAALVLTALGAAGFAIAFRALLGFVFSRGLEAKDVVSGFEALPAWARVLLPAAGGLLAGLTALAGARTRQGQGVGDVMEAVVFGRVRLSLRRRCCRSLGSLLAIASGGSIGREGPLIQFGGAIGATLGRRFAHRRPRASAR